MAWPAAAPPHPNAVQQATNLQQRLQLSVMQTVKVGIRAGLRLLDEQVRSGGDHADMKQAGGRFCHTQKCLILTFVPSFRPDDLNLNDLSITDPVASISIRRRRLFLCQDQMGWCDCLFPRFAERFLNAAHVVRELMADPTRCLQTSCVCASDFSWLMLRQLEGCRCELSTAEN